MYTYHLYVLSALDPQARVVQPTAARPWTASLPASIHLNRSSHLIPHMSIDLVPCNQISWQFRSVTSPYGGTKGNSSFPPAGLCGHTIQHEKKNQRHPMLYYESIGISP